MDLLPSPSELLAPFEGLPIVLLAAGAVAFALWLIAFTARWLASFPDLPAAAPATMDLGPEPPAVAALLVNRWSLPRTAIAATLVDLAARHQLGIDEVGGKAIVRIRQGREEPLNEYEEQLMQLVRARATGGSAPIDALDLGEEAAAERWWDRFNKSVVKQTRSLGLARSRWTAREITALGGGLLVAAELIALAFALAHIGGDKNPNGGRDVQWGWIWWVFFGWVVVAGLGLKVDQVRDTPAGRVACAQWLGVRQYLRNSHAFDDVPPAAVAVWDRYLAYGVAVGVARNTAHELPIAPEEPGIAWSRETGSWRQIRIKYPTAFGYGESPGKVFFKGLGLTALFGAIAFFVLPILFEVVIAVIDELTKSSSTSAERWLVIAFGGGFTIIGAFFGAKLLGAVVRLVRGALDLRQPATVEGLVVKAHLGRAAVDTGSGEEIDAWMGPPLGPHLMRGSRVRASVTRHLHYVSGVTVLAAPGVTDGAITDKVPTVATLAFDLAALSAATGITLTPATDADGSMRAGSFGGGQLRGQVFSDGAGGRVMVSRLESGGALIPMLSRLARLPGLASEHAPLGGADSWWMHDRELVAHSNDNVVVVVTDLPQHPSEVRHAVAAEFARQALAD